ncbi:MAG: hypothetical protein LBQ31_02690 [Bacteroidales bacterium]|nr:hypothetical protein [Bacteroidales bacterium]
MAFPRPLAGSWAGSGFHLYLFCSSHNSHPAMKSTDKTLHHCLLLSPLLQKRISVQSLMRATPQSITNYELRITN